jgi:hypothetical protein
VSVTEAEHIALLDHLRLIERPKLQKRLGRLHPLPSEGLDSSIVGWFALGDAIMWLALFGPTHEHQRFLASAKNHLAFHAQHALSGAENPSDAAYSLFSSEIGGFIASSLTAPESHDLCLFDRAVRALANGVAPETSLRSGDTSIALVGTAVLALCALWARSSPGQLSCCLDVQVEPRFRPLHERLRTVANDPTPPAVAALNSTYSTTFHIHDYQLGAIARLQIQHVFLLSAAALGGDLLRGATELLRFAGGRPSNPSLQRTPPG